MFSGKMARIGVAFAFAAMSASVAHAQSKEISFGIISTESTANLKQDWAPLIEDMSKRTGMKVNAFFAPDYAGVIEGMRFNKVQIAWMGNKSGMEAVDRASAEVFAQVVYADGSPGYWSLLITHKDSPYKTLEDVLRNSKNINFGIGDPNSTSGFLVPSYYVFALNKVDPKTAFKTVRAANHETNLMAVIAKQVDVAAVNTETVDKFQARMPEKMGDVRVIWKSPLIPSDPMVWRKDLDADTKAKLKQFFISYGAGREAAREQAVLAKLTYKGFRDSGNHQLIPIRQLELFKDKVKLEADSSLAAGERKARLDDIDRKLSDLNQQLASVKQ